LGVMSDSSSQSAGPRRARWFSRRRGTGLCNAASHGVRIQTGHRSWKQTGNRCSGRPSKLRRQAGPNSLSVRSLQRPSSPGWPSGRR